MHGQRFPEVVVTVVKRLWRLQKSVRKGKKPFLDHLSMKWRNSGTHSLPYFLFQL
jgi:hypothetical protein